MLSVMPGTEQALVIVTLEVEGPRVRDRALREAHVSSLRHSSGAGATEAQYNHSSLSSELSPAGSADDKWSLEILLAGHEQDDSNRQLLKEHLL